MVSKVKKKANVQQDENHGVEKESSRRKEIGSPRKGVKGKKSPISVIFIDNTRGGRLAKVFREEERRLGNVTGYNIRVAEMA